MAEKNDVFKTLNDINVNDKVEKKNNLSYLSWAYAWGELKKHYPDAKFTVYENKDGWNYHTDGRTAWVKTGVTIEGVEYIEYLPVMDYRNRSIPLESLTSMDVTKAIQRSITKAIARHGLGLYIYAGEDLPDEESKNNAESVKNTEQKYICKNCEQEIQPLKNPKTNAVWTSAMIYKKCDGLCMACHQRAKGELK